MIDEEKTLRMFGHTSDSLKPYSNKKICHTCDVCGTETIMVYSNYTNKIYKGLCRGCGVKKGYADDPDRAKRMASTLRKAYDGDPSLRERQSIAVKRAYANDPTMVERLLAGQKKSYADNPGRAKHHSIVMKKLFVDDLGMARRVSIATKKAIADDPTIYERISAGKQGIAYEDCTHFVDKSRPYITPSEKCIKINKWFKGSHAHHITKSIIIHIPSELHRHIYHNIQTGNNMGEINVLAIQFLNGGL